MSDTHAQTVAFMRDTMLPEAEPPLTEKGVVKWMRENLFSSAANGVLTLLSMFVIYYALSVLLPWIFGGVWNAASLTECREILTAYGKSTHGGACWAVIDARWHQFLFGFYPSDQYWRPILTFALFFVAIAPILFSDALPKKMFAFSAAYPFIAVWLIWGGSFWLPILMMLGFAVAYIAFRFVARVAAPPLALLAAVLTAAVWWGWVSPAVNETLHKMVATPKIAEAIETLPGELETLRAGEDEFDVQLDALTGQITQVAGELQTMQDEIATLRADGADVASLMPGFEDLRVRLADLRAEQKALSTARAQLGREISAKNRLNTRVGNIESLEESLPAWRQEAIDLRANLPESVAALRIAENLPSEIESEDVDLLRDTLTAESRVTNTVIAITETNRTLGLIGLRPVGSNDIGGFLLAIVLGLSGIVLSLPLGILLALGRQSDMLIINKSCVVFIEVIRGVPLIVWLFTASLLLNYFLPPGTNFDIVLRVVIMVTLFSSAYIAEVIRGGLAALPRGQYEGGDSLGLNYWQSMRLIVLPQALKISIPGIVNTFIGLFKDTTLVVFVGLFDPLKQMADAIRADSAWTGIYWEVFFFPGIIFFVLCFSMGRYSLYLERKLQRENR